MAMMTPASAARSPSRSQGRRALALLAGGEPRGVPAVCFMAIGAPQGQNSGVSAALERQDTRPSVLWQRGTSTWLTVRVARGVRNGKCRVKGDEATLEARA